MRTLTKILTIVLMTSMPAVLLPAKLTLKNNTNEEVVIHLAHNVSFICGWSKIALKPEEAHIIHYTKGSLCVPLPDFTHINGQRPYVARNTLGLAGNVTWTISHSRYDKKKYPGKYRVDVMADRSGLGFPIGPR